MCILYSVRGMIVDVILAPRARVGGRNRADFQNFACKIARFSTANVRNLGAERARMTQEKRADSFQMLSMPCHAIKSLGHAFAGAGRVSRAKIAPKLVENFAISTENHGF